MHGDTLFAQEGPFTPRTIYEAPRVGRPARREVITSTCGHNCGGRCVVNAHVVDGRMVKISTDPRKWSPGASAAPRLRARLRAGGARLSSRPAPPPLRRKGPRGAGQWERDLVGRGPRRGGGQMRRVRDTYGAAAILDCSRSGSTALLHNRAIVQRLLHLFGGCTELWSNLSAEAEIFAVRHTFGAKADYKAPAARPGLPQLEAHAHVGLEPGRRALRHQRHGVCEVGQAARHAHRVRGPAGDPVEPAGRRRAHLHPALDGRGHAHRHGLRHRERGAARPGVLRPPRARPGRGAPAAGRAARLVVPLVPVRPRRRRAQDAGVGGADHRGARRDHPPAGPRVRHREAGGHPLRLRAGAHALRRAVPPRRLHAGRHHRQHRHPRRQPGCSGGAKRRIKRHAVRRQSHGGPGGLEAARRPAGARQGRRLSRPTSR